MLSEDVLKRYLKAGHIASEVRRKAASFVKEGVSILQICERVESTIKKMGGAPAFPCNVCINDVAAHYSSPPRDTRTIPKNSIVKIDIGVHVEGYIADTAITVSLTPEYDGMVYAVNEALEQAIKVIKPRFKISEVGRIIQKTIQRFGFKPIKNLTGHQMSRYILHSGKSIPNVHLYQNFQSINEGEIYAIEPFLTLASGNGEVKGAREAYIYRFQKERRLANPDLVKLLKSIKNRFRSLPFSPRWIKGIEKNSININIEELTANRCLSSYPVLIEKSGGIVAQAEHTVIITKEGCIVITQ